MGLLLGVWLAACDGWVKILARSGCCDATASLRDAAAAIWTVPSGCEPMGLVAGAELSPTARAGATPFGVAIPAGAEAVWGLALFAVATILTILVLRWRDRARGDMLALGTLWAGVAIHGLPRLAGPGTSFAEVSMAGMSFGIADLAIAWALLWLAWRFVAELRA